MVPPAGAAVGPEQATDRAEADSGLPGPLAAIAARPRLAALLGAMCIAFSGIFYRWAEVSPSTATVYRALFGLPLLGLVAYLEHRRYGALPARTVGLALFAGVFFAGDHASAWPGWMQGALESGNHAARGIDAAPS